MDVGGILSQLMLVDVAASFSFSPRKRSRAAAGLQNGYWNGLVNMYTLTNGIDKIATDAALVKSINMAGDSINLLLCYKKAFSVTELQMLKCWSAQFC